MSSNRTSSLRIPGPPHAWPASDGQGMRLESGGRLAHLIAAHKAALIAAKDNSIFGFGANGRVAVRGPPEIVTVELLQDIISFEPESREDALSKLTYLASFLIVARATLDDQAIAEIAASVENSNRGENIVDRRPSGGHSSR